MLSVVSGEKKIHREARLPLPGCPQTWLEMRVGDLEGLSPRLATVRAFI